MPQASVLLAQLESREQVRNRRGAPRRHLELGVFVQPGAEAIVHDLSVTGLLIETIQPLECGEKLLVQLPDRRPVSASVVWNSGLFYGCEFEDGISVADVSAVLLRSPIPPGSGPSTYVQQTPVLDSNRFAEHPLDEKYSVRKRMWILIGLVVATWTLIGLVTGLLY